MAEDSLDINGEYEKLFGSAKRVNLFETEEEYNELRQYIMSEPQVTYITDMLPFEGIELPIIEEKPKRKRNRVKDSMIVDILASLIRKRADILTAIVTSLQNKKTGKSDKLLFFIKEKGVCEARGYYDEEQKFFYVCKDSLVSYDTDIIYMVNDNEKARDRFLKEVCEEANGYYRVIRDAKCRSASAAACYVLGYQSDQNRWKDSDGRLLSDVYPHVFFNPIEEKRPKIEINNIEEPLQKQKTKQGRLPRYYYITREGDTERSCSAKGEYDKKNDKFIILAGSKLSREVARSYSFSASDIKRKKFIQQYCGISRTYSGLTVSDFELKKDGICNSPDEAACYVLGEVANGWKEWKSKDGIPLEGYINKI